MRSVANAEQDPGIRIVQRALEAPLRVITANAGDEPSVVIAKVLEGKGSFSYNAATAEYCDLVDSGVVDPTKVTRTALQNAASIAGLILTTDATVADAPKEDKPIHLYRRQRRSSTIDASWICSLLPGAVRFGTVRPHVPPGAAFDRRPWCAVLCEARCAGASSPSDILSIA